jgi:hypothetical protein
VKLAQILKDFPCGLQCFVDGAVVVGGAGETGLELGWGEIDAVLEHAMEESGVSVGVGLCGVGVVVDGAVVEE